MQKRFTVLVNAEKAEFNLIDGLWQEISSQFNKTAISHDVFRISYIVPRYLFLKCKGCDVPDCVRIFENDIASAEAWLSEPISVAINT